MTSAPAHTERFDRRLADSSLLQTGAFIDGAWLDDAPNGRFDVMDPATGETIAAVRSCGRHETAIAIRAAAQALDAWRDRPARARSRALKAIHAKILQHAEDLAQLITWESGKPIGEARGEVSYGAAYIEWFAEQAPRANGDIIPPPASDRMVLVTRAPVGVVACITPWNFPLAMLARKIAPALAAGCTVVCKPSEETPLTAFALAELAHSAGLPRGVLNVVAGDAAEIGAALLESDTVRKLTFTGSTAVGKQLAASAARTVKRTSMELGGNAPCIVFADADLQRAAMGLMSAKFRNAGQTCIAVNRVLIARSIADDLAHELRERMSMLRLGPGRSDTTSMGPLIHKRAADRVERLLQAAQRDGATVERFGSTDGLGPAFVRPALVTNAAPSLDICTLEVFGPVLTMLTFDDEDEAVEMANATPSGLAAYLYSQDHRRLLRVGARLHAGMIGANETALSNEAAPFGGVKESGYGREGSVHGLDDYLDHKYLCLGGLST